MQNQKQNFKHYEEENMPNPVANKNAVVRGDKYRFTVLTNRLLRLEYDEDGQFEDRATQCVVNRDFPVPEFTVSEKDGVLTIETDCLRLEYRGGKFTRNTLNITYCGRMGKIVGTGGAYYFGDENVTPFRGTLRTLDGVDGEKELPPSIMSNRRMTHFDDSQSLALTDDFVEVRKKGIIDTYVFGYSRALTDCLDAYYELTGKTPLLPRFALGNWWSKYFKYTEKTYLDLMNRFKEENIPISVAVIDMDWHKVDIDPKYGSGWTGFSWNTDFFPDPKRFLASLHALNTKTSLNLHPAGGVSAHEDCYEETAKAMGVDPKTEQNIPFDIAEKKFIDVYFDKILKPLEDMGVDFWWMDWQQGNTSKTEGLDPLWMLNHYHYNYARKDGKRGILFSRFSGYGSQRYPVGFSGDTHVTWNSLDFQPYFTSSAANVGYGWWSHDIGGHMMGYRDDELMNRWTQLGVFSPIMRLHSSNSEFIDREPWNYSYETHQSMRKFMRLRCEMIPYLYTMNYRASAKNRPLVMPLYYFYDNAEAQEIKNEYMFGTELIVSPITHPGDSVTNMGNAKVYLPEGEWFDFFNKYRYSGNRTITAYRKYDEMPVFAKAGAIIPMSAAEVNPDRNPDEIILNIFPGADNSFTLYEDDNLTESYIDGKFATTEIKLDWADKKITIGAPKGDLSVIPENRRFKIVLNCVDDCNVSVNGEFEKRYENGALIVEVSGKGAAEIVFDKLNITENDCAKKVFDIIYPARAEHNLKKRIIESVRNKSKAEAVADIFALDMDVNLKSAVLEVLM